MWYRTGLVHLLIGAILTLVVKTFLIPYILYYTVRNERTPKHCTKHGAVFYDADSPLANGAGAVCSISFDASGSGTWDALSVSRDKFGIFRNIYDYQ